MSKKSNANKEESPPAQTGISHITVAGFKSISDQQSIDIKPLTILAGVNSSGKSSIMQPLLLLKQTLEATYDPGALLLDGPNVKFTSASQLFSRIGNREAAHTCLVRVGTDNGLALTPHFSEQESGGLGIQKMVFSRSDQEFELRLGMGKGEIRKILRSIFPQTLHDLIPLLNKSPFGFKVFRNRCFLDIGFGGSGQSMIGRFVETSIREAIHLPGLRGNPERTYPTTAVGPYFPGTFEKYAASVIAQWQAEKDEEKLQGIGKHLEKLGLTWKVTARPISDTQVELQVGRLPHAVRFRAHDLVNIADVGFGVSQTLPVLVALLEAKPGQLVYIEEPEIHLHPRAQSAMAQILADAAQRGVRVVIETHSQLLLLGIQTLVAEGKLSPDLVKLHWFKRRNNGSTEISSADLNEAGTFGNWPEDFAEVALEAESRYLDAAESKPSIH